MAQNWFRHALDRTGWRSQNQVAGLIVLGVVITLIFAGVYLTQIANYATTNRQIVELIAERDRLERRNEELRAEIAQLQTVPRLLERAETLGFTPADAVDIEYLVIEGYNPNRTQTAIQIIDEEEIVTTQSYDETFSGWLRQQWDGLQRQFENFGT
jgi:cell division protein FtsB